VFPIAFRIGDLTITWYGVLVAVGFLTAVRWSIYWARRNQLSGAMVERLAFWNILAAIVGSRLLYVWTELPTYLAQPALIINPREGGLVFLGGLLGAVAASVWVTRHYNISFWRYADILLPAVAIGHAFGRVGCYAVGCCYGTPAPSLPWAVQFPASIWTQIAPVDVPLHPVQLYAAGLNLTIFVVLVALYRRRRFDGQMALGYLGLYSVARIVLELFRGDDLRGFVLEHASGARLSTSQFTSMWVLVGAAVAYGWLARRRGGDRDPTDRPSRSG